jgi:hypothetical protein
VIVICFCEKGLTTDASGAQQKTFAILAIVFIDQYVGQENAEMRNMQCVFVVGNTGSRHN